MIQKKSDDAVSPVLGVMLMVVITVVIGAVIAAFATGMVADTEPTPNAVLKVEILSNSLALEADGKIYAGPDFQITHISGDAVDTGDIEIQLSWTHDGCSHYSTYSAEQVYAKYPIETNRWGEETGGIKSNGNLGVGMERYQPMYVKSTMPGGKGSFGLDHYFGDVILTPGLKLTASTDCISYINGETPYQKSPFMNIIFDNGNIDTAGENGIMDHLTPGTVVDVMIIHLPSDKAIYDKKVTVQ